MEESLLITEMEKGLHEQKEETALFGMGCFWGPDARFGSVPGVVRTRVGYAGGTKENPTYRQLGDHTETVEVVFNPAIITYEELLLLFWTNHYPNRDAYKGRQYVSLLRYYGEHQFPSIRRVKKEMEAHLGEAIETEIAPFESFTPAEEHHQKYYLKRYPKAIEQIENLYPELEMLINSTFAARLNGFVKGFGNLSELTEEIRTWPITGRDQTIFIDKIHSIKW